MDGGYERDGYTSGAWRVEDRTGDSGVDPWYWQAFDRQDEYRREAARRAVIRRARRSRIDWHRSGGFVILNPTFTVDELGPRGLSAWLIRSDQGKGGFPLATPRRRRRRRSRGEIQADMVREETRRPR